MNELSGKIALVTGAGVGIGRGCAIALAKKGAHVIVNDVNEQRLSDTLFEVRSSGGLCDGVAEDLFDRKGPEAIMDAALTFAGKIDILVTGPASSTEKSFLETDLDEELRGAENVLFSHLRLAQRFARKLVARDSGGRIIFISSVYGTLNRKKQLGYDVGKAGLNQATRKLARELGRHGILVNAIAPGFTDTPGERESFDKPEAMVKEISDGLLLGRAGTPGDIGHAAVFLAESMYTTGIVLTVDGGMSLVDYTYDKNERR